MADTDGDGIPDCQDGSWVCTALSPTSASVRRLAQFYTPSDGSFQIATWGDAAIAEQRVVNRSDEDCANGEDDDGDGAVDCTDPDCVTTTDCGVTSVSFDREDPGSNTAGFVLSRPPLAATLAGDATALRELLAQTLGASAQVTTESLGAATTLLGDHPSLVSVRVTLQGVPLTTASELRTEIVALWLDRLDNELSDPPDPFGPTTSNFTVAFAVQHRPGDGGTPLLVVLGAVADLQQYDDPERATRYDVQDVASGVGLADATHAHESECKRYRAGAPLVALDHPALPWSPLVALDALPVPRSPTDGWSGDPATHALSFTGFVFDPQRPSEVVVAYERWITPAQPAD